MVQNGSAVRLSIDGHTIANAKVDNFKIGRAHV